MIPPFEARSLVQGSAAKPFVTYVPARRNLPGPPTPTVVLAPLLLVRPRHNVATDRGLEGPPFPLKTSPPSASTGSSGQARPPSTQIPPPATSSAVPMTPSS